MIELLGIKFSYEALAFLAAFLGSELVGVSKLKSNSLVQLVLGLIETLKPIRQEDDKIEQVKAQLAEIRKILEG